FLLYVHQQERGQYSNVTQKIQKETEQFAIHTQQYTTDRRAYHACRIKHRRVECNGIWQIFRIVDQGGKQRLPRQDIECIDYPLQKSQNTKPQHRFPSQKHEQGQQSSLDHEQTLRRKQHSIPRTPVHETADEWGKK